MPDVAYMIDESHNLKDPLEDLIQATDAIQVALAQALCVNRADLADAQAGQRSRPGRRGAAPRRSAPTCGRWWPRPGGATAPPSTRSATYRAVGYRAATVAEPGRRRGGHRAL